jgi:hypothetical protein
MSKRSDIIAALCCGVLMMPFTARASDAVTEWNQIAAGLTLSAVPAQAPVQQTRTMAIVAVSVHDAVNAITGEYDTYSSAGPAPASASPDAAAIAAAYNALLRLFPTQAMQLKTLYDASLVAHNIAVSDPGLEFGKTVAGNILALRANDHAAEAQFDYTVPGAGTPGVWERLGGAPALLPGWGSVTPWVLRSGDQFRPDGPPALTSETYANNLNEVQDIGSVNSLLRTNQQTQIALFWRASPTAIWNVALIEALAATHLDLSTTARSVALVYLAAADVSTACWDAKYTYNSWRPLRAIVNADLDGNPATAADPNWLPLLPTPPHPEYPSGHGCNSSAMATVLETVFGNNPGVPITVTLTGITRQWQTFDQGVQEVIDARVYSGIHFRNSDEVGVRLGRQVAQFVMTHALRPPTGSWKD